MVGLHHAAVFLVDEQFQCITDMKFPFADFDMVQILAVWCLLDIEDIGFKAVGTDLALVGDLTTGFRIEAGMFKGNFTFIIQNIDGCTGLEKTVDFRFIFFKLIAGECEWLGEVEKILRLSMHRFFDIPGISCHLSLSFHAGIETFDITLDAFFFGRLDRHLFREAIRIIEFEDHFAA